MKVLIPVDGSPFTGHMLAYLATHADWLGRGHRHTVLTVVPAVPPRAASSIPRDELNEYYAEEAEKVLAPVRSALGGEAFDATFEHRVGHVAEQISQTAKAGCYDLVVMGSHGHSALGNLVLGSVATRVLASCGVPVLVVR